MDNSIETLIEKIKADIKCDGKVTISSEEADIIVDHYNDCKQLQKRFTEEHFDLLNELKRQQNAYDVLRRGSGDTHDRRKQALGELGFCVKKKPSIAGIMLLLYYANLINGIDPITGESNREKITKQDAVKKIADERGQTEQAIVKHLQKTSTHLKKKGQLPAELKGILPPNWPEV